MGRGAQEIKNTQYTLRLDDDSNPLYTYIGEAIPVTPTSDPGWRIKRMKNADTTILWAKLGSEANASADFNKIWDNRVSYTYQ